MNLSRSTLLTALDAELAAQRRSSRQRLAPLAARAEACWNGADGPAADLTEINNQLARTTWSLHNLPIEITNH